MEVILACSESGVIGENGDLPWSFKEDMRHFKQQTIGKMIIMGSGTWRSIGSKPLPGRTNYVVTRGPASSHYNASANAAVLFGPLEIAADSSAGSALRVIIGGARLLDSAVELLRRGCTIHLTIVCDWERPGISLSASFLQLLQQSTVVSSRCIVARERSRGHYHHLQFLELRL
jgi:dihydrofolate reductase